MEGLIKIKWWKDKPSGRGRGKSSGHEILNLEDAPPEVLSAIAQAVSDQSKAPVHSHN